LACALTREGLRRQAESQGAWYLGIAEWLLLEMLDLLRDDLD
jgi:hypothetical protein